MTLALHDATFAYTAGAPVLRDISLAIQPGVTCIIGPNGAGKSTLLRILLGTLSPQSGRATLDDEPIASIPAARRARRIAYIAQRPEVAAPLTVREVVALGRFAHAPGAEPVRRALETFQLGEMAGTLFQRLSVGQQQRVSMARAWAQLDGSDGRRRVLLADEPMSAMDPAWISSCSRHTLGLAARGVAIVLVLHDFTLAARIADRIAMLDRTGRLHSHAPPRDVLTRENLAEVFHVPFDTHEGEAGPVIVPDYPSGKSPI